MSLKRTFTDFTTQESQTQDYAMPYAKRTRYPVKRYSKYRRNYGGVIARVPRPMSSNTIIIPRTVDYDFSFGSDVGRGFSFGLRSIYVNGITAVDVPGANEISGLFELCRIHKVEITILPGNNVLDVHQTTSPYQIPWLYEGFDPSDSNNPTLASIREVASTRTHLFDKVIRRTIYPVMQDASNVVDIGSNRNSQFTRTFDVATTDVQYCGYKMYFDLVSAVNNNDLGRIVFKIFYECRSTK